MKLPCICTNEKLKRLLELGYTVDTTFGKGWSSDEVDEIEGLHMGSDPKITAIYPPKFKRYEKGDFVDYADGLKGEIWIVHEDGRYDIRLLDPYEIFEDVPHFSLLPYFEEEPTTMDKQRKLLEYLQSQEWKAEPEEEGSKLNSTILDWGKMAVYHEGKQFTLTPKEDE